MTSFFAGRPAQMEVDLAAIRHNVHVVRRLIGPHTELMAVVKADAYGHGMLPAAGAVMQAGASHLAVATVEEASELRAAYPHAPILILGWTCARQLPEALKHNCKLTVFDLTSAQEASAAAQKLGLTACVHLKVDSGMARLGLSTDPPDEQTLAQIIALPNLRIEGIYSHFSKADDREQAHNTEQLRRYFRYLDAAARRGLNPPLRHIANGPGIINFHPAHLDMVRTGILLYGCCPANHLRGKVDLRPAMRIVAQVSQIHQLKAGDEVGYGGIWQAPGPSRVATLPLGYADGLPRLVGSKAEVLICGKRAPLVGNVCMDQVMADVTRIPEAAPGAEAVLVGIQGTERITMEELAAHAQTIHYEMCTRFGQRLPRVYLHETD